jgi:peroxiredoxin
MRELGSPLPHFELFDTTTQARVSDQLLRSNVAVVAFICNHCPFVVHIRAGLAEFGRFCKERGVSFVAISSNDVATHPDDGPEQMAVEGKAAGYEFPYLYDETQDVARAFDAACTPDFFVFDTSGKLAYRGQFDASRPGNQLPVSGDDLRAAVLSLLAGHPPSDDQKPSIGCNIKWRAPQP